MNFATFYQRVAAAPFGKPGKPATLKSEQVSGMAEMLGAASAVGMGPADELARARLAYCFATAYHETAFTMQPIAEFGGAAYFHRMYDPRSSDPKRAAMAARMGAKPGDGVLFYGRGYVQLTWRANYLRMGRKLGIDLVADPERAREPGVAAAIMYFGMRDGDFTGKRLADYFQPGRYDWVNARRIINGVDKAEEIGQYGRQFFEAFRAAAA